jgi:hypothetical protein
MENKNALVIGIRDEDTICCAIASESECAERMIEPQEAAQLIGDIHRNQALAGEVFFIHGGLRLGSRRMNQDQG